MKLPSLEVAEIEEQSAGVEQSAVSGHAMEHAVVMAADSAVMAVADSTSQGRY